MSEVTNILLSSIHPLDDNAMKAQATTIPITDPWPVRHSVMSVLYVIEIIRYNVFTLRYVFHLFLYVGWSLLLLLVDSPVVCVYSNNVFTLYNKQEIHELCRIARDQDTIFCMRSFIVGIGEILSHAF